MNTCDYAACHHAGPHQADGWRFCSKHLTEHQREFAPILTLAPTPNRPARRTRATSDDQQRAEAILQTSRYPRDILLSTSRTSEIVHERQRLMWRIRNETKLSFPQIGAQLGRDHSTVIKGIQAHERRISPAAA